MTDNLHTWLNERQAIHAASGAGRWEKRLNGHDYEIWEPGEFDDAPVSSFSADPDATAIVDAHNMFPRALDALNAVLELHASDMLYENVGRCENYNEYHVDDFHTESEDGVEICMGMPTGTRVCRSCRVADEPVDWPCETIQSIEGAING